MPSSNDLPPNTFPKHQSPLAASGRTLPRSKPIDRLSLSLVSTQHVCQCPPNPQIRPPTLIPVAKSPDSRKLTPNICRNIGRIPLTISSATHAAHESHLMTLTCCVTGSCVRERVHSNIPPAQMSSRTRTVLIRPMPSRVSAPLARVLCHLAPQGCPSIQGTDINSRAFRELAVCPALLKTTRRPTRKNA